MGLVTTCLTPCALRAVSAEGEGGGVCAVSWGKDGREGMTGGGFALI